MEEIVLPISARKLSTLLGTELVGDPELPIERLASLSNAPEGSLTFVSETKRLGSLEGLKGAVVIAKSEWVRPELPLTYLVTSNPQGVFSQIARQFRPNQPEKGRHINAFIAPSAELSPTVRVGSFATIEAGARVGARSSIGAHCFIGEGVSIGEDTILHPNVTVLAGVRIGSGAQIFSGTVIGSDGFGLMPDGQGFTEVPQIGTVVIEDNVRIGANCTIDRATLDETRIGEGTKIDNLVHIAHNVRVGKNCVICGQSGIAGSTTLGEGVTMGGQSGVSSNLQLGSHIQIGGRGGVVNDLPDGASVFLYPAVPSKLAVQIVKGMKRLPELYKTVRELEKSREGEK